MQREFDKAHRTLDEIEAQLTAAEELTQVRVRYLLERGRVFNSAGQPDVALPLFKQAWGIARAAGVDFYTVDAAHMLAIVEPDAKQQLDWNERALQVAEASSDEHARGWLGSLYNNIGWTYHDQGQYEKALEIFRLALEWHEKVGNPRRIAIARWTVARALRSLGRVDEALAFQMDLQRDLEQQDEKDGYVYEEIAECLLALGEPEKARPYFALAYAELAQDPWLSANEAERLARLKRLST